MRKRDESGQQPEAGSGGLLDPKTPVPVVLELHEALALAMLYENAPDDVNLMDGDVWYGESLDLAMLRIGEGLAHLSSDEKELRLIAGAIRAAMEQER